MLPLHLVVLQSCVSLDCLPVRPLHRLQGGHAASRGAAHAALAGSTLLPQPDLIFSPYGLNNINLEAFTQLLKQHAKVRKRYLLLLLPLVRYLVTSVHHMCRCFAPTFKCKHAPITWLPVDRRTLPAACKHIVADVSIAVVYQWAIVCLCSWMPTDASTLGWLLQQKQLQRRGTLWLA